MGSVGNLWGFLNGCNFRGIEGSVPIRRNPIRRNANANANANPKP